jgi:predicted transcriptional regulator
MPAADRSVLHVRIPRPLHERLTATADERMVGTSLIVERAVEQYLDALVPVEPATNGATS